jgi:HPt (histidine-containing phosphotransfer) domain-containing protein
MTTHSPRKSELNDELAIIDEGHLQRMTLGDRHLAREVLQIFVRQSTVMLDRIDGSEPVLAAEAAHTMIGSARGIGAWRLARVAERLERVASGASEQELNQAIAALRAASFELNAAIGAYLLDPPGSTSDQA